MRTQTQNPDGRDETTSTIERERERESNIPQRPWHEPLISRYQEKENKHNNTRVRPELGKTQVEMEACKILHGSPDLDGRRCSVS